MPETLQKLRPDRDLQCYFQRPSAAAALSASSATGFTVSGSWRQQFDWVVIEWNRDNVFEHPALRNLPDGDLSGVRLSYEETRENCIPIDSTLYATVDWPSLRIWLDPDREENPYKIPLMNYATPIEGRYQSATATFELQGTTTADDYVELAWKTEHYTYQMRAGDILETAVAVIVEAINANPQSAMKAERSGKRITLTYTGAGQTAENSTTGSNGNRVGVYGNVLGPGMTESWQPGWQLLSGGVSPSKWRIDLDFSALRQMPNGPLIDTTSVRKMRWTYSADLQPGAYQRTEFAVNVANWSVTGTNLTYRVAGPGSRRIEDDSLDLRYTGSWDSSRGNYSGGSIHYTSTPNSGVSCTYVAGQDHTLYLGTRKAASGAEISISVDSQPVITQDLLLPIEDVLVRIPLGSLAAATPHTVSVVHNGAAGSYFYFDFFELAVPTENLPVFPIDSQVTLATDWDTDHSIALAPERTAWLIRTLGFTGRANHYAGALWFYELYRLGHSYASGTVEFIGTPQPSQITQLEIGLTGSTLDPTVIQHLNLYGDTAASIAKAFELELNSGYTAVRAEASGNVLTIFARAMGAEGNRITLGASSADANFVPQTSGPNLAGGVDGVCDPDLSADALHGCGWRTDLSAVPRINRAARDWTRSFVQAMAGYGIDVAVAFSMELQNGDPTPQTGIAQRYPSGHAVSLNTPALQTNFSPTSAAYWQQTYLDMAAIQTAAGQTPYLQFGEVQWWYFPDDGSGMPLYDAYTTTTFAANYGRPMHVFTTNSEDPSLYPEEAQFLRSLISAFTNQMMSFVRQSFPNTRFEVLYPPDVNITALNTAINLPDDWSTARLDCFKTENFIFTGNRNLDQANESIQLPLQREFLPGKSSHLIGIGDYTTPWQKETRLAKGNKLESVVLFALDQFCLIGYAWPLPPSPRRSLFMG